MHEGIHLAMYFHVSQLGCYCTCPRARVVPSSRERVNRLRSNLVQRWGPVSRAVCKSQLGPTLHVRTCRVTVPDLKIWNRQDLEPKVVSHRSDLYLYTWRGLLMGQSQFRRLSCDYRIHGRQTNSSLPPTSHSIVIEWLFVPLPLIPAHPYNLIRV